MNAPEGAAPALGWPRALRTLAKALGSRLWGSAAKKFKSPGGPELTVSWEKLSNESVPRKKPEATCGYFFTLEMK